MMVISRDRGRRKPVNVRHFLSDVRNKPGDRRWCHPSSAGVCITTIAMLLMTRDMYIYIRGVDIQYTVRVPARYRDWLGGGGVWSLEKLILEKRGET